jgi:hypothetical protein
LISLSLLAGLSEVVVIREVELFMKGAIVWFISLSMLSDLMLFIVIPIISVVEAVRLEESGAEKFTVDTVGCF